MATNSVETLKNNITAYQYNPVGMQTAVHDILDEVSNGTITIVDPSNPFSMAIECAAIMTSAFMIKDEACIRRQYPVLAQTQKELYLHMSDKDYINRFSSPSKTKISFLIALDAVKNNMMTDETTGIRKVVIPRNTKFTVAGVDFSIQYPIEIRQLQHGGLQIVYNNDILSPLQELDTNIINFEIRNATDGAYVYFEVDVQQFSIVSISGQLVSSTDFEIRTTISDQFYFARVYYQNSNSIWVEMKTTHSDQVYDIKVPTAVITIDGSTVIINIPQIYSNTSIMNKNIRADIYQTKGELNMILWEYSVEAFSAKWLAIDDNDNDEYVSAFKSINTILVYSDKAVYGGKNSITFDNLRSQVITNSTGAINTPITPSQIKNILSIDNYTIVTSIDNITNRIFTAVRDMPVPTNENLITAANASISTISTTVSSLIKNSSVIDNGNRITITPNTIFKASNGIVSIVSDSEKQNVLSLVPEDRATVINENNYLFTPFHYVLDTNNDELDLRPYYLNNPEIITKLFVEQNDTTLLQVNVDSYNIEKTSFGYTVYIKTVSGDTFKTLPDSQITVQLAYIPFGEKKRAYLNGTLIRTETDGERIFSFSLLSTLDIDSNNALKFDNFMMYNTEIYDTRAKLITDFDILFTTSSDIGNTYLESTIDSVIGKFALPDNSVGITYEKIRVRFGYFLDNLWAKARSTISSIEYKTWSNDVPRVYENDVYEVYSDGTTVKIVNDEIVMNILHHKGNTVYDAENKIIYLHKAGDIILDTSGNPIVINTRDILRQVDILTIEAVYEFATDSIATEYKQLLTESIVSWIMDDLGSIETELLENTDIYFYPNVSLGSIKVLTDNSLIKTINANQTLSVQLSVSELVYNDSNLREKLETLTIKTIGNELKKQIISIDGITSQLRVVYGEDVISVSLKGLGGSNNYQVVTVVDSSQRCSIAKRLKANSDNKLVVEEAIDISFIKYSIS